MTVPAVWPHAFLYISGRTYDPTVTLETPPKGDGGTDYFVDGGANGDDANDGQSMTPGGGHGPKKTINAGIALMNHAGDRLLIKGGVYYTHDDIVTCDSTAGTADNPLIIGPYNGEEVVIDPSLQVSGWEVYDAPNNIYRCDISGTFTGDLTDGTTNKIQATGKYPRHLVINYNLYWQEPPQVATTQGDFVSVTNWTYDGWTHPGEYVLHTTGNTSPLSQTISVYQGYAYIVKFTISNRTAGDVTPSIGAVNGTAASTNAIQTQTIIAAADVGSPGNVTFALTPSSDFNGRIDNVIVYCYQVAIDRLVAVPDASLLADGSTIPTDRRWCYDYPNGYLYVRTDEGDPDSNDVGMIYCDSITGKYGVVISTANWRIYGLTARFAPSRGFSIYHNSVKPTNVTIEWCRSVFNGYAAIKGTGTSCKFIKNFAYGSVLSNSPRPRANYSSGWDGHVAFGGSSYCEHEGNISYLGWGEGLSLNGYLGNSYNKAYNNIVYGGGTGCYVDSESYVEVYGNISIGQKPAYSMMYRIRDLYALEHQGGYISDSVWRGNLRYMRGYGFTGGAEVFAASNNKYYNNIIVNRARLNTWGGSFGGMTNIYYIHNTYIMPRKADELAYDIDSGSGSIYLYAFQINSPNGLFIQNNLIYKTDNDDLAEFTYTIAPDVDNLFTGITINYNLWYAPTPTDKGFYWPYVGEGNPHQWVHGTAGPPATDWMARNDPDGLHGIGDVTDEPQLVGGAPPTYADYGTDVDPADLGPASVTSPGVGKGTTPPFEITTDFFGNPRVNRYDMGAIQYYPGYTPATPLGIEGGQPAGMPGGKVDGI